MFPKELCEHTPASVCHRAKTCMSIGAFGPKEGSRDPVTNDDSLIGYVNMTSIKLKVTIPSTGASAGRKPWMT